MLGSGKLGRSAKRLFGSSKSRSGSASSLVVDPAHVTPQLMNAELGEPATPAQELIVLRERVKLLQEQVAASVEPAVPTGGVDWTQRSGQPVQNLHARSQQELFEQQT